MTVVRPNSIAGINSITVQTGQALNIHDASGNLIRSLTNESGISTFSGINIGTAATIFANGNATFSGIVTASSFSGATALTGSTNNTLVTVTGSNAIQGEANLTFDGNALSQTIDANDEGINITASGAHAIRLKYDSNPSSADDTIYFQSARWNGTEIASIHMRAGADTTNKDDGRITFHTTPSGGSNTERLRITDGGNVGIGTDTTSGYTDRMLTLYNPTTCYLEVRTNAGDNNSGIIFSKGAAQDANSYRGYIAYNHSTDYMTFHTGGGTRRGMFDANGLHFDTNNNSAATGLDDYEQGTFTPTLSYSSGASGVTYSAQQGRYTKIGDTCFFQLRVNLTSKGTSSGGNVQFGGLPFTPSTHTITNSMVQFDAVQGLNASDDGKMPFCQVQSGVLVSYWHDYGGSGGYSEINHGQLSDSAQIAVSGEFRVGNP